jgi:hypothetical protein
MNTVQLLLSIEQHNRIAPNHGKTSTKRLYPIHQVIGQWCQVLLGSGFVINGMGLPVLSDGKPVKPKFEVLNGVSYPIGKEEDLEGAYKGKSVDVSCVGANATGTALIKFPQSCYEKNSTNAVEHLLGETANLQRGGIVVAQMTILQLETPILDKEGNVKKIYKVSNQYLQPYMRLYAENPQIAKERPEAMCVMVTDTDQNGKVSIVNAVKLGMTIQSEIDTYTKMSDPDLMIKEFVQCLKTR